VGIPVGNADAKPDGDIFNFDEGLGSQRRGGGEQAGGGAAAGDIGDAGSGHGFATGEYHIHGRSALEGIDNDAAVAAGDDPVDGFGYELVGQVWQGQEN